MKKLKNMTKKELKRRLDDLGFDLDMLEGDEGWIADKIEESKKEIKEGKEELIEVKKDIKKYKALIKEVNAEIERRKN